MTYFTTNNYWRFTWKRGSHGTVLLHSLPTGLYYTGAIGRGWCRSLTVRRMNKTYKMKKAIRNADAMLEWLKSQIDAKAIKPK